MRANKEARAVSHAAWAHTLTRVLCWPFKPPGPSWGNDNKSKFLEQGTWEAERQEVRTVRGTWKTPSTDAVVAGAGAHSGLILSRLPPKPARGPGAQLWAVSKDKFSTDDLILQNSPRASERSGQHHFDKVESGRHCWSYNVGGGTGVLVLPSAHQVQVMARLVRPGHCHPALLWVPETPGTVSWYIKASLLVY